MSLSCSNDLSVNTIPSYRLDHRSYFSKIVDVIKSIFNEIKYNLVVCYYRFISTVPQLSSEKIDWHTNSKGLIVFVHGLRSDPAAWHSQLSFIPENSEIDIYAPVVPKRGMCSLDQAATPLLPKIEDYVKKNPGKPVCLLGTSNGGRIVTWLETALRHTSPSTPVKVSSVAGVHFGSSRMALLEMFGLAGWFYPQALRQELKYGSDRAKQLLEKVQAPMPEGCALRNYEFYATSEDLSIPDLDSTLPKLQIGGDFHMVHGEGHSSIVSSVAKRQMNSCFDWIDSFSH